MSTHEVSIIEIGDVLPHGNAERLEIVPVGGWQAVVKKGQFKSGDRAVYIQPDYTVPTARDEFSFLAKDGRDRHRLKAVRLRGVLSYGLLIPVPDECCSLPVGADVMEALDIERYEPPVKLAKSDELPADQWPDVFASKFDVESLQKYPHVLQLGEMVIVTEKIHGANAKAVFIDGVFYMGSRTRWLKPDVQHPWKVAFDAHPEVRAWCEAHPGVVLYGEIYGSVQSLKYGCRPGEVKFAAFASSRNGEWLNTVVLGDEPLIPMVPILYQGPYYPGRIMPFAESDSEVPGADDGHMKEGIVIVPKIERRDDEIGRVVLKHISNRYWESAA